MDKPTKVVGRRVGAFLIDLILLWIVELALFFAMAEKKSAVESGLSPGEQVNVYGNIKLGDDEWVLTGGKFVLWLLVVILIGWLYMAVLQGKKGWTLGKLAVGIRTVAEATGREPGVGKATVRWLLWIVDSAPWLIPYVAGFVTALATKKNQRVGDLVAKTLVVRKDAFGQPVQFLEPGYAGAGGYGQAPAAGGYAPPPPGYQPPPPGGQAAPPQQAPQQADWYPDPQGQSRLRYWDGQTWTEHTSD
jgi:uncharacterized RDD family membrane protein YckC